MADDPEAPGKEEAPPPQKKSKLVMFIALGVGVMLLAGGGFFAYTKFIAPKPSTESAETEGEKTENEAVIGQLFALAPFVVNLADPKGKRYLKVKIELELGSAKAPEKAEQIKPKLRDMVIMMLTSLSFEEVMTPEGKIRIRDELVDRFNQIMKPERVEQIYFTDFVVQ